MIQLQLVEGRRRFGRVGQHQVHAVGANERQPTGQHLKHDHADAVDVAAVVNLIPTYLFGADVTRGTNGKIEVGFGDGLHHPLVEDLGKAEVHDLDLLARRVGVHDHEVGRL